MAKNGLGIFKESIKDFEKAIEIDPKNSLAYYNLGTIFSEQEKYEKALEIFNKAIKLDSNNPYYFLNRGYAKFHLGKYEEAIKDFESYRNRSKNSLPYFNRGICNKELKNYSEAIKDFDEVIKLDPNYINAFIYMRIIEFLGRSWKLLKNIKKH